MASKGFCEDFLTCHPGYTIRLSGSAIESFLKHNTSGHLSGVNYAPARAAILTRGSVQGRKRNVDYRRGTHITKAEVSTF